MSDWIVTVVCGPQQVNRNFVRRVLNLGNADLRAAREDELESIGIPHGCISPIQFLNRDVSVSVCYDRRLLSQLHTDRSLKSGLALIDFSTGSAFAGVQEPEDVVTAMFSQLGATVGSIACRSDFQFPCFLRDRLSPEQKREHLELLLLLAKEDKCICKAEQNLLLDIAKRIGLPETEFRPLHKQAQNVREGVRQRRITELGLMLREKRRDDEAAWIIFDMALLAHADGDCNEQEITRIRGFADVIGLPEDDTESLIMLGKFCHGHNRAYLQLVDPGIQARFRESIDGILEA